MRRVGMIAVLCFTACAAKKEVRSDESVKAAADAAAAADMARMAAEMSRLMQENRKACEPLETRPMGAAEEKWLGDAVAAELVKQGGAVVKDDVAAFVQTTGEKVAKFSARPEQKWSFTVVDQPAPGSRSGPDGRVVITTGLLMQIANEAELAGALAHEIAHSTQHASLGWGKAKASLCLSSGAAGKAMQNDKAMPAAVSPEVGTTLGALHEAMLKPDPADGNGWWAATGNSGAMVQMALQAAFFVGIQTGGTKEQELEADDLAVKMLAAAGYDVKQLIKLVERLPAEGTGFARHANGADRLDGLAKTAGATKGKPGKAPPLPRKLKWPRLPG